MTAKPHAEANGKALVDEIGRQRMSTTGRVRDPPIKVSGWVELKPRLMRPFSKDASLRSGTLFLSDRFRQPDCLRHGSSNSKYSELLRLTALRPYLTAGLPLSVQSHE
jgi:hypothetical protein